jgi:hypothetical protein
VEHDAQARRLPVKPDAASPQPAELLAKIGRLARQHLFFDLVERLGDALGKPIHRIRDIFDDGFEQRCDALDAASAASLKNG